MHMRFSALHNQLNIIGFYLACLRAKFIESILGEHREFSKT